MASLGVDSWGVDYGLVDRSGRLLAAPVCYRDERTKGRMDEVFREVPRREIFGRTGIQFMELNTLYQLVAEARGPGIPPGAHRLLLMADLIHARLGGRPCCEFTLATTSQMVSAATGDWDRDLLERLGLPSFLLPDIVRPGTFLGTLGESIQGELAVPPISIVAPAAHDTASAVAGTPLAEGWAFLSSGTWSLLGVEIERPLLTDAACDHNFTNEGGAAGTVRLLKNVVGLWILESCRKQWSRQGAVLDYETLGRAMRELEGPVGAIDPDQARFFNPRDMVAEVQSSLREAGEPEAAGEVAIEPGDPGLARPQVPGGDPGDRARDGAERPRHSNRRRREPERLPEPGDRRPVRPAGRRGSRRGDGAGESRRPGHRNRPFPVGRRPRARSWSGTWRPPLRAAEVVSFRSGQHDPEPGALEPLAGTLRGQLLVRDDNVRDIERGQIHHRPACRTWHDRPRSSPCARRRSSVRSEPTISVLELLKPVSVTPPIPMMSRSAETDRQHLLAERSEQHAESGVEVASGQRDLGRPGVPEDLRDRNRTGDDLKAPPEQVPGDRRHRRAAVENDGLTLFHERRCRLADPRLLRPRARAAPGEIQPVLARLRRHGAAVDTPQQAAPLEPHQVAANRGGRGTESAAQVADVEELARIERFPDLSADVRRPLIGDRIA